MDTTSDAARVSARLTIAVGFGVALITFLFFLPTLEFGFLNWDDDVNVFENSHVQGLTSGNLAWMFTDFGHAIRYKPLSWLGWAVVHSCFGLNPFGYHLANVLLHCANAILVFHLLRELIAAAGRYGRESVWICGLGALSWSLHPLRVEPVAWVTGMPYGQALAFVLLSTLFYLRAQRDESPIRSVCYWMSVISFVLAVLTYPIVLGFPAMLLAMDHFPLRRFAVFDDRARNALVQKIPYALVSAAVVGFTVYGRYRFTDYWIKPAGLEEFGVIARLMQAGYVWAYYAWKPFLPTDLSPVYTMLIWNHPFDLEFILSAIAVTGVSGFLIWKWRQWPVLAALWFAHLGLLVPMLGLTERPHYPHDRYGIVNGLIWSMALVAFAIRHPSRKSFAVGAVLVVALGCASRVQEQHWRDDVTFFSHMADSVEPCEYRNLALLNLGEALTVRGRYDDAIECFVEAADRDVPWVFPFDFPRLGIGHARALIGAERWPDALAKLRETENLLRPMEGTPGGDARLKAIREAITEVSVRAAAPGL
ncbi:MAG: hypothetical protein ISQ14_10760 [Verrucomicrobiae bacterium]|nr:hypothetical protein [Verrucomicrobiae bacterium]